MYVNKNDDLFGFFYPFFKHFLFLRFLKPQHFRRRRRRRRTLVRDQRNTRAETRDDDDQPQYPSLGRACAFCDVIVPGKREQKRQFCLNCQINVRKTQTRDPVRSRSRSSFFVVSFYYLFFPPPFSRGRWRRRRVSGRYLTTTDVNSFARAQNRSLYSFEL